MSRCTTPARCICECPCCFAKHPDALRRAGSGPPAANRSAGFRLQNQAMVKNADNRQFRPRERWGPYAVGELRAVRLREESLRVQDWRQGAVGSTFSFTATWRSAAFRGLYNRAIPPRPSSRLSDIGHPYILHVRKCRAQGLSGKNCLLRNLTRQPSRLLDARHKLTVSACLLDQNTLCLYIRPIGSVALNYRWHSAHDALRDLRFREFGSHAILWRLRTRLPLPVRRVVLEPCTLSFCARVARGSSRQRLLSPWFPAPPANSSGVGRECSSGGRQYSAPRRPGADFSHAPRVSP